MYRGDLDSHYRIVKKALEEGRVVPLLGAGVNLCERQSGEEWVSGSSRLPSALELAGYLTREFETAELVKGHERDDLVRVSQTVATMNGTAWLYEKLHSVFDADYEPTPLHRFLARLPAALRDRGSAPAYQLILTTNYDDTLERAFRQENEPYDLVWYVADGDSERGRLWHSAPPHEVTHLIERANEYDQLSLDERTVILKVHGAVDRTDSSRDSFVITEDHYIDFLSRSHVANLVPAELLAKLNRSHFLFLAYALRDWNVRVILHRIWARQALDYPSWAVQRNTHPVDERLWAKRNVDIYDIDLGVYVRELADRMRIPI
jgi:hypothetical protein